MPPAVRIRNLGKQYSLGERGRGYTTFREAVSRAVTSPWRRFKSLAGRSAETETFWALKDVSFDIEEGEVVGIIGRNGAGKSTLLKILSQITEPTTGEVDLHGRVGSLLEVGTGFHPELTGRENIYLNGAILGMKRHEIQKRFDEIVAFSEIEKFLDTPVKRYSSGMYMRLAFAVAAHLDPEVLVVDEVLAVGDMAFQEKCLGRMREASRSGITVLFVSHNMAAVESLCNRGIVLDRSRVVFDGNQTDAVRCYFETHPQSDALGQYRASDVQQAAKFKGLCIRSASVSWGNGQIDGTIPIGAPLEFALDIRSDIDLVAPDIGIGINNARGLRVVTFHTKCDPRLELRRAAPSVFRITCCVSDLNLIPGRYFVTLSVFEDILRENLENAFTFNILPSDFFGNAGQYVPGVVFGKQKWAIAFP